MTPNDSQIEKILLASCVFRPALLLADGVSPELFYHADHRALYQDLVRIHADYGAVPSENLPVYLRAETQSLYYDLLEIASSTTAAPEIKRLTELAARRRVIAEAERAAADAADMERPLPISADAPRAYVFSWSDCPPEEPPTLYFKENEILSRQGIALLTGPAGKGKSQIFHAICAVALNQMSDGLGFKTSAQRILYIDTENPYKIFRRNCKRTARRAVISDGDDMPGIRLENIRGLETIDEKRNYLRANIVQAEPPDLVLIDGIGDFVLDVNNAESCIPLIAELCALCAQTNISIFCSLHGNPMGEAKEKARGVLGSELIRKADASLLLRCDGDIRVITSEFATGKNRAAGDTMEHAFRWDDESEMFKSCDAPPKIKSKRMMEQQQLIALVNNNAEWRHKDLCRAIMEATALHERSAKDRISDLCTMEILTKDADGLYRSKAKPAERKNNDWIHN
jgi:hypothetical protein